jgi:hypothetical protein
MNIPFFTKTKEPTNPFNGLTSTKELRRRISKILFVDDEKIEIVQDIRDLGYNANLRSDISPENIGEIERGEFQIVFLDFEGVGKKYGDQQGLGLLRHIKNVAPSVFIVSYTSKSIRPEFADFYRLADTTLGKDRGIGEAQSVIDAALEKIYSPEKLWSDLNTMLKLDKTKQVKLSEYTEKAISKKNFSDVVGYVASVAQNEQVRSLVSTMYKSVGEMIK